MVPPLKPHVRNTVLRYWTQGFTKSDIARNCQLSWPSVHKIIEEWKAGPGKNFSRTLRNPGGRRK